MSEKSTYLVVVRLAAANANPARLRESAPIVKTVIEKYSDRETQLVFTTPDGSTFGWFINTNQPIEKLRAALYGETKDTVHAGLLNDDSLLILQVGEEYAGRGFSQAWTWLQHHKA